MHPQPEQAHQARDRSNSVNLETVSELASDIIELVDRLEADLREQRVSSPEIADQLHELRLRSGRLVGIG